MSPVIGFSSWIYGLWMHNRTYNLQFATLQRTLEEGKFMKINFHTPSAESISAFNSHNNSFVILNKNSQ